MPISFNCPSCQRKLTVKDEMAGQAAKCPCGARLTIPQTSSATAPQPAVASAGTPSSRPAAAPASGTVAAQPPTYEGGLDPHQLNPDFKVQCIQCGQQYPMRPDLFGQTVACRCGAPIRFDDPLGPGGMMTTQAPAKIEDPDENPQPVAYKSLAKGQEESKQKSKAREEEVLKMYIKEDPLEAAEKGKKPKTGPRKAKVTKASFGKRALALLIDGAIIIAIHQAIYWPLVLAAPDLFEVQLTGGSPPARAEVYLNLLSLMLVLGGVFFVWFIVEIAMLGTPGKTLLGIEILDRQGYKPSTDEMAMRSLYKHGGVIVLGAGYAFLFGSMVLGTDICNGVGGLICLVFIVGCFFCLGESKLALQDKISKTQVAEK